MMFNGVSPEPGPSREETVEGGRMGKLATPEPRGGEGQLNPLAGRAG